MKTIGLIGGMTWQSTQRYYQIINETIEEKLKGFHSAKCIIYSLDFGEIVPLQNAGDWANIAKRLLGAASTLERSHVDFLVLCTNTLHIIAKELEKKLKTPLLNIVDVTGEELNKRGYRKVGLLGTRVTMEHEFYKKKLNRQYGIDVQIPDSEDKEYIDSVIFTELCKGIMSKVSQKRVLKIIKKMENDGAEGMVVGCTEISFLLTQTSISFPLVDTLALHAKVAAKKALGEC